MSESDRTREFLDNAATQIINGGWAPLVVLSLGDGEQIHAVINPVAQKREAEDVILDLADKTRETRGAV